MLHDKSALALLAGLLIGAGLGFGGALWAGTGSRAALPPGVPSTGVTDPDPEDSAASPGIRRAPITASARPRPASVSPEEVEAAVAAVERDAEPVSPPPAGDGRIEGVVRSVDGKPIGRVLLVAVQRSRSTRLYGSDPDSIGRGRPLDRSLHESLATSARSWAQSRGLRYRVHSDEQGRFAFEGLAEGRYRVTGYADGWVFEASPGGYLPATASVVYLTGTRVRDVTVDVRLPDGTQPEVAAIQAKVGEDSSTLEWRPEKSTLRLREGSGTLQARAQIVALASGTTSPPGMESGIEAVAPDTDRITLRLAPNTGLWGEVRDAWGGEGMRSQVRLVSLGAGGSLRDDLFDDAEHTARVMRGVYHIDDLIPGTYGVALTSLYDQKVIHSEIVRIADELTRLDLEIPVPDPDDYLRVTCIGPEGHMLSRVNFRYSYRSAGSSSSGGGFVKRAPDGTYWLATSSLVPRNATVDFDSLPAEHTLELTARHDRYGSRSVRLVAGQREVSLRFAEPCALEVQVVGYETSPLRGKLQLALAEKSADSGNPTSPFSSRSRSQRRTVTSSGLVVYDTLAPGTWVVSLLAQTRTRRGTDTGEIAKVEIDLRSGRRRVNLTIPPLYDLEVHAPGLEPKQFVWIQRLEEGGSGNRIGGGRSGSLDADRRVRFRHLAAGIYRVQGSGLGKSVEARVPGPPVVFEGATYDCYRVAISSTDGILHRAGLRAGDLVVAVGGTELTRSNLYGIYQKPGKQKIVVLRNGQRHELELDMTGIWNRQEEMGGTLMLASRGQD